MQRCVFTVLDKRAFFFALAFNFSVHILFFILRCCFAIIFRCNLLHLFLWNEKEISLRLGSTSASYHLLNINRGRVGEWK